MSGGPLSYLSSAGPRAQAIVPLTWYMLLVSVAVCLIIAALLWAALQRARPQDQSVKIDQIPIERGADGIRWISIGLIASAVPLLVAFVWTMLTLAAVAGPPAHPGLVLDVTGRQWWWQVTYDATNPVDIFETANEIHIPVGVPVLVRLHGADVIHSFWVPQLTGKTDTIPGQTNLSWIQADRPGRYLGQCTEFCGYQHAHMQFEVVAEPRADFDRWVAAQRQPAVAPVEQAATRGLSFVEYRCGLCHRVRGTGAGAVSAPDLTHLMSRRTLAAGTLLNNPGNLAGWIQVPQNLKPGSLMPNQQLSAQELTDTLAYLETLQ
jgi:cytochrome c oxidase subunit II